LPDLDALNATQNNFKSDYDNFLQFTDIIYKSAIENSTNGFGTKLSYVLNYRVAFAKLANLMTYNMI